MNVPGTEGEVAVFGFVIDDEGALVRFELVEHGLESLGLVVFQLECLDDAQLAIAKLGRERRAQRAQQHLARQLVAIIFWLRPMDGSAVAPQRRTDGAHTRSPGALLSPTL